MARRAVVGTLWASAESWGQQAIQLLVFITLARLLGPEAYGLVGIALIVTTLGTLLIGRAGWAEALIERRDLEPIECDSLFWFLGALSLALLAAIGGGSGLVAGWFDTPEVARLLPWLALALPLSALGVVPGALLRRQLRFKPLALRSFAGAFIGGTAGIAAALGGAGAWSLVAHQLAHLLTEAVVLWAAVAWRPRIQFSWPHLGRLARFTSGVLVTKVLYVGEELVARTLIARSLGAVAVGHFGVARRILLLSEHLLVTPLSGVAMPVFAKLALGSGRLNGTLRFGMQIGALVAFPGYVGLALIVPDLLPLVFGRQWSAAVPAVQLAALLGPPLAITRLCDSLLLGLGHTKVYAALYVVATAVLLCLLLVPERLTVEAVMGAMVVRTYLTLPLIVAWVQWVTGVDVRGSVRSLAPLLGATVSMVMAVLAVQWLMMSPAESLGRLALSVSLGAGVYGLVVWVVARPLVDRVRWHIRGQAQDEAAPST